LVEAEMASFEQFGAPCLSLDGEKPIPASWAKDWSFELFML
jgi:hypothetical protein